MLVMPKKSAKRRSDPRGDPVSLAPLSMNEAVDTIFAIKSSDVKKVIASNPGNGKNK